MSDVVRGLTPSGSPIFVGVVTRLVRLSGCTANLARQHARGALPVIRCGNFADRSPQDGRRDLLQHDLHPLPLLDETKI